MHQATPLRCVRVNCAYIVSTYYEVVMAGFKGGRRGYKAPKNIGRGILEAKTVDGPHTEWLGMKP
jgi:hypothetical protein